MKSIFMPGKILISGEHSVVYGHPALAASIDLGIKVSVKCEVLSGKSDDYHQDDKGLIDHAIKIAGGDPEKIEITIESNLPIGSGLGSSAAVCAGVIKAVREYLHKPLDNDELFKLTWECEKLAHTNSSGVDPAAVIYQGLIWYIRNQHTKHFKVKHPVTLMLANTGKPVESTGEMVTAVAVSTKQQAPNHKYILNNLENIGEVTMKLKTALKMGSDLVDLINENGVLLEELGVVGKRAIKISENLRNWGAGVKITGAGGVKEGSGMLLILHRDFDRVAAYLEVQNINHFLVTI